MAAINLDAGKVVGSQVIIATASPTMHDESWYIRNYDLIFNYEPSAGDIILFGGYCYVVSSYEDNMASGTKCYRFMPSTYAELRG